MSDLFELPSQARRRRRRAATERSQGSIEWSSLISDEAAKRIVATFWDSVPGDGVRVTREIESSINRILRHSGHDWPSQFTVSHLRSHLQWDDRRDDAAADLLQAMVIAMQDLRASLEVDPMADGNWIFDGSSLDLDGFAARLDALLEAERISWAIVGLEVIERRKLPMHQEIVKPLELLLRGDVRFEKVSRTYAMAIRHTASGEYEAAVTAMTSALQDALAVLGAQGQALGVQVADATQRSLVPKHDAKLFRSLADWSTSARSQHGIAHGGGHGDIDDARFALRLVGAGILRIATLMPASGSAEPA